MSQEQTQTCVKSDIFDHKEVQFFSEKQIHILMQKVTVIFFFLFSFIIVKSKLNTVLQILLVLLLQLWEAPAALLGKSQGPEPPGAAPQRPTGPAAKEPGKLAANQVRF